MNILKKLTIKDLKLNKKRTIGTLVGIILATALITVVGGMFYVLQNTFLQESIKSNGYYHILLYDLTDNQIEEIKNNKDFSKISLISNIGYALTPSETKEDSYYSQVFSMDKETFDYLKYDLVGDFPKDNSEIIINKYYARNFNVNIGDKITINIGDIADEDGNITNEYSYGENYIVNDNTYEFTVVGITDRYPYLITTNLSSDKTNAYLTLKNPRNYKTDLSELLGIDITKNEMVSKYTYEINTNLLRWEVFSFSDETISFLYRIVGIIILIILVTSVFSIRNSFAISTTEKLKTYGMLSSIGATKKQIRKSILFEGFYLGSIGLSIGALFGTLVTFVLTKVVNYLLTSGRIISDEVGLYYKFSIIPIIIAFIVGIVMIYLSVISCARKASKVSPIQNIRNADNLSSKKMKLKVPKWIQKVFKIGGVLSYKNLKRSKKKYRVTVISLTVCIFVFITVSSFVEYGIKIINEEYKTALYNVSIGEYENNFTDVDVEALRKLDKSHLYYRENYHNTSYSLYDTSHINYKSAIINSCVTDENDECTDKYINEVSFNLAIYDDESFREYAKMIDSDYNDIKDKMIVINQTLDSSKDNKAYVDISNYKSGDVITLEDKENNKTLSYEVGTITDIRPWGLEYSYETGLILIVNKDYYEDEVILSEIYYETNDSDKLVEDIEKISDNLSINNIDAAMRALRTVIIIVSIFVYGFIIVVTLIGITSVFNTITSNMELRKRDFAMLKSIGMTKREFNNMITLESFFYSFKSLFYGAILGLIGSYLVYKVFAGRLDFGYILPIKSIIIAILFIVLVVLIIMKYSISKIRKQNIIETIRKENI